MKNGLFSFRSVTPKFSLTENQRRRWGLYYVVYAVAANSICFAEPPSLPPLRGAFPKASTRISLSPSETDRWRRRTNARKELGVGNGGGMGWREGDVTEA